MDWQVKPGCPEHHRAAVERMVRALPPAYLLLPCSSEIFEDVEACNRRLHGYALAEGFDIVREGGGLCHGTDRHRWRTPPEHRQETGSPF